MIDIQVMRHSLAPLLARLEIIHYSDIKKIQAEVVQSVLRFLSIIHWWIGEIEPADNTQMPRSKEE